MQRLRHLSDSSQPAAVAHPEKEGRRQRHHEGTYVHISIIMDGGGGGDDDDDDDENNNIIINVCFVFFPRLLVSCQTRLTAS